MAVIKNTVSGSKTLQHRLTFSEKSFSGLGLLTAAGVATQEIPNIHIEFIDENMEAIRPEEWPGRGYDLLATGGTIYQMNRMLSLIHMAQRENLPVVVGGAAVMTFPDIFKRKGVSVILGESETLFPDFIKDLQNGSPQAIYRAAPGPGFNLSESPIPDYPMLS